MDIKEETKKAYEMHTAAFEQNFGNTITQFLSEDMAMVNEHLSRGNTIIDIGSGPGNQAVYLREIGYHVLCVDNSPRMVKRCQEKGLPARLGDIETLSMNGTLFHCAWAYASLLHLPKVKFPSALQRIRSLLKPKGFLFLGMKRGEGEKLECDARYPACKRWFSYYHDEELESYFDDWEIIHRSVTHPGPSTIFMNYFLQATE